MKKQLFLFLLLLISITEAYSYVSCRSSSCRSSYSSSRSSYRSSSYSPSRSIYRYNNYNSTNYKSSTVKYAPIHSVNKVNLSTATKNRLNNSPSCRLVKNNYVPVYHYDNSNLMMWYFIFNRNHKKDTIWAKSKSELDKKVKNIPTSSW